MVVEERMLANATNARGSEVGRSDAIQQVRKDHTTDGRSDRTSE